MIINRKAFDEVLARQALVHGATVGDLGNDDITESNVVDRVWGAVIGDRRKKRGVTANVAMASVDPESTSEQVNDIWRAMLARLDELDLIAQLDEIEADLNRKGWSMG